MENEFKIDIKRLEKKFGMGEGVGLTHNTNEDYNLFPFIANEKTLFTEFDGVVGAFSRYICKKKLNGEFDSEKFIEEISECIGEYEGNGSKGVFKDAIRTMFIEGNNLVDFDIKAINYKFAKSAEEKIARFLYSIFFDEELEEVIKKHYDRDVENILYKVVLKGLPELKEKSTEKQGYVPYVGGIKKLFIEDFKYLIQDEDLYKKSIKRFLEYYYMFYISQTLFKLNKFDCANLESIEPLYYTVSWEKTSKHRTSYAYGLEKLKRLIDTSFAHAVTLEILNTNDSEKKLNYVELAEEFRNCSKENVEREIEIATKKYKEKIGFDYSNFKYTQRESETIGFEKIFDLYKHIEYQFIEAKGTRKRANEAYRNWYLKFLQKNFGKNRGRLGYVLNFTEEDVILMTKICIKNLGKMKLSILFREFEKRGVYFDRDSQTKITQLYEKLNLLEKKSDSGDAQYVRSIL